MDLAFVLNAAVLTGIYYLLAAGLNLQYGCAGVLNLGVHGFFAIGAYSFGLLTQPPGSPTAFAWGLPWPLAAAVAVVVATIVSIVVAALALVADSRSRSPYLVPVITLAVAETLVIALSIHNELAGGYAGLFGVPQPLPSSAPPAGTDAHTAIYLVLVLAVAAICTWLIATLVYSPFGRVLRGIRDDEVETRALGRNPLGYQLTAVAVGGALMGLAGVLWAGYMTTLQPTGFTIIQTLLVVIAVISGGRGNLIGCALGSIFVFGVLNELSRFLPEVITSTVPAAQQILLGVILVVLLRYRPNGLLPEKPRKFRRAWRRATQAHASDDPITARVATQRVETTR